MSKETYLVGQLVDGLDPWYQTWCVAVITDATDNEIKVRWYGLQRSTTITNCTPALTKHVAPLHTHTISLTQLGAVNRGTAIIHSQFVNVFCIGSIIVCPCMSLKYDMVSEFWSPVKLLPMNNTYIYALDSVNKCLFCVDSCIGDVYTIDVAQNNVEYIGKHNLAPWSATFSSTPDLCHVIGDELHLITNYKTKHYIYDIKKKVWKDKISIDSPIGGITGEIIYVEYMNAYLAFDTSYTPLNELHVCSDAYQCKLDENCWVEYEALSCITKHLDKIQIICADYNTFFDFFDNLLQCT
eukprot:953867_1